MNLRNVLKVYGLQRQFSDDESALLKTLQSLNDTERDLLVESLSPAQKKSSKKTAGKSRRATGIQAQLNTRLAEQERRRQEQTDADDSGDDSDSTSARCQFTRADDKPCHLLPDHNIHHMTTANEYHPFASLAQSAQEQSTTGSSETGKAAAGSVAQGASGGD